MQSKSVESGTKRRKAILALATLATLFFAVASPIQARADEPKDTQVKLKHKVWKEGKWQAVWLEKFKADDLKQDGDKVKAWVGDLEKKDEAKNKAFIGRFVKNVGKEKEEISQPFQFAQALVATALAKRIAIDKDDAKPEAKRDEEFEAWLTGVSNWLKDSKMDSAWGRKKDGFKALVDKLIQYLKSKKKKRDLENIKDEQLLTDVFVEDIKKKLELDPKLDEERPGDDKDKDKGKDKADATGTPTGAPPTGAPPTGTPPVPTGPTGVPPTGALPPGGVGEDPSLAAAAKAFNDICNLAKGLIARKAAADKAALDAILAALAAAKDKNDDNKNNDTPQLAQAAEEAAAAPPASASTPPPPPSGGAPTEAAPPPVADNGQGLGEPPQPGQIPPQPQQFAVSVTPVGKVTTIPYQGPQFDLREGILARSDQVLKTINPQQTYLSLGFTAVPTIEELQTRMSPQAARSLVGNLRVQALGDLDQVNAALQSEQTAITGLQKDLREAKMLAKQQNDPFVMAAQEEAERWSSLVKQLEKQAQEVGQVGQGGQQGPQFDPNSVRRGKAQVEAQLAKAQAEEKKAKRQYNLILQQRGYLSEPISAALQDHQEREARLQALQKRLQGDLGQLNQLDGQIAAALQAAQQPAVPFIPNVNGGRQLVGAQPPVNRFNTAVPAAPGANQLVSGDPASNPGNGEFRMRRTPPGQTF